MEYFIITNNPVVADEYADVLFLNGSVQDILIKVRDLVYEGHELLTHPLAASLKMLFSPYRSVIVGKQAKKLDEQHAEIIEQSISTVKKHLRDKGVDTRNAEDYKQVDSWLLGAALAELTQCSNF